MSRPSREYLALKVRSSWLTLGMQKGTAWTGMEPTIETDVPLRGRVITPLPSGLLLLRSFLMGECLMWSGQFHSHHHKVQMNRKVKFGLVRGPVPVEIGLR
jgi:hypothetical protein